MYLNMKDEKLTTSDINEIIIEDKAYLNIKENIEFRPPKSKNIRYIGKVRVGSLDFKRFVDSRKQECIGFASENELMYLKEHPDILKKYKLIYDESDK